MCEAFDHGPPRRIGERRKGCTQSIHNHMVVDNGSVSSGNLPSVFLRHTAKERPLDLDKDCGRSESWREMPAGDTGFDLRQGTTKVLSCLGSSPEGRLIMTQDDSPGCLKTVINGSGPPPTLT